MVRKTALVTAMLGVFAGRALALGLGDIELKSALNQPLDAEIQVISSSPHEVAELHVGLASAEAYRKAGLERIYLHTKLRFTVERKKDGSAVIRVTSREPIREPFLDFMVEASWGAGEILKEYTVLVDPPALMPAPPPEAQAPAARPVPKKPAAAPAKAPTPQAAPVPSRAPVRGETYTKRNDTLWAIAERVRPDEGVSMEQVMLALLEANPEAFYAHNINNLKAGYVLRVPSREEMTAISKAEAKAEVRRQYREWREGRARPGGAASRSGKVERAPAQGGGEAAPSAPGTETELKLVAPETGSAAGSVTAAGGGEGLDEMRKELALAVEAVEAQRQQNKELNDRLSQLEDQIAKLQRLIQLKDDELARLQAVAGGETEGGAAAQAPGEGAGEVPDIFMAEGEEIPGAGEEEAAVAPPAAPEAAVEAPAEQAQAPAVEEAPAAQPPQPEPEQKDEGLLARFLTNPLMQAGAAGAVALLALFGWLGARKKRMAETEFQESILAESAAAPEPTPAAPEASEPEPAPEPVAEETPSQEPQSDSSLFTDFAVSDMGSIKDEAEADPIAEADVYLAYGRYQQAEDLIKGAIEKAPEDVDLKVKLLEIYFAAKNTGAFDAAAESLLSEIGQDDPNWERVASMGRELNPSSPLYGGQGGEPAAPATEEAAPLEGVETLETEAETEDNSLEFTLEEAPVAEAGQPVAEEDASEAAEEMPGLDFDLGEVAKEEEDQGLEFDLGEGTAVAGEETAEEVVDEEGVLTEADEVATKLDLARAYIEMGDPEGAKAILEEVMDEGNAAQKSEAEELMKEVS
ncbi:MAG TPA: tetratricopeptide repeat protein [Thiotrichales bacterium]|nr:tetratricopeptide repeat protein [Thiotrichales bacterium]